MAKQRHDIGYRKRLNREQPRVHNNAPSSLETLAHNLVKRGLAHPVILQGGRNRKKTTWTPAAPSHQMDERHDG